MITPMRAGALSAIGAFGSSSITPKANNAGRYRETLSATPTPAPIHEMSDDNEEWPDQGDWGDEAVLEWRAEEDTSMSGMDDDASSVAREDAGLPEDDDEDEDETWGQDALMTWDEMGIEGESDDNEDVSEKDSDNDGPEPEPEPKVETEQDLIARGMPTYRDWTIKKLQVSRVG